MDVFRAAVFLPTALATDARIMLCLLLAREYFSAREVLRLREVFPIRLRRTERRLSLEPVGVAGLFLRGWEGS